MRFAPLFVDMNTRVISLFFAIVSGIFLAACSANAGPVEPATIVVDIEDYASTDTPEPTQVVLPTETPTPLATDTPTATPTEPPTATPTEPATPTPTPTLIIQPTPTVAELTCNDTQGEFQEFDVIAGVNEIEMATVVYLPPCYSNEGERYPVLYLLHGLGHDEQTWRELGIGDVADELITAGDIRPFIIAMPRERGGDSQFDNLFLENIIPFVEDNFYTSQDRAFRALGGMSRGAGWTVQMGLQNPELFGILGLHSMAIFYSDEESVEIWLERIPPELQQHYYIDIGERDSLQVSARYMDRILRQRDIDHVYVVVEGGTHTLDYWGGNLEDYLRWYATRFGRHPNEIAPELSR